MISILTLDMSHGPIHAIRDLRLRGASFADAAYAAGAKGARYPLPCTFGQLQITRQNVYRPYPQGWDSEVYIDRHAQ